jgi:hypothetical protein
LDIGLVNHHGQQQSHHVDQDVSFAPVLAESAHPFEDPPLGMNNPFGLFELTS